jgi:hypothetical protein
MTSLLGAASEAMNEARQADDYIPDSLLVVALQAIREPSEAMLTAAIAPYRAGNTEEFNKVYRETIAGYWRAMIDVLIAEGEAK